MPSNDDGSQAVLAFNRWELGASSFDVPPEWSSCFIFSRDRDLCRMIGNILFTSGAKTDNRWLRRFLYQCPYDSAINWPSILTNRELRLTTETTHYRGNNINTTEFPAGWVRGKGLSLQLQSGPCMDLNTSEVRFFVSVMHPQPFLWRTQRGYERLDQVAGVIARLVEQRGWTPVDFRLAHAAEVGQG